jgi:aromatic-L-amino-acid decarboxylase
MDYRIPLGSRFRALKLWFVMRSFGHERVMSIVRSHLQWAAELAREIAADPRFEVLAPVFMSLVCFRFKGTDDQNRRLLELLNASGVAFSSGNVLNGKFGLRIAIGNLKTTREDVFLVWETVRKLAGEL